jgi:hypothetical protein
MLLPALLAEGEGCPMVQIEGLAVLTFVGGMTGNSNGGNKIPKLTYIPNESHLIHSVVA